MPIGASRMTHHSTFCTIASTERVKDTKGSAAAPTLSAAIPTAAEITMSCRTLNEAPSAEVSRPRKFAGTRPSRKSHQEPVVGGGAAAVVSTELWRPGSVSRPRPRPMPIATAINAVVPNHSSVCPASRAALDTCSRLAMLTMIAVTINGTTITRSSATKVLPMVCRVLVNQLGVPSATAPPSRGRPGHPPRGEAHSGGNVQRVGLPAKSSSLSAMTRRGRTA